MELSVMTRAFRCFIANESGATAVEYGLIAALVSLLAGAIVQVLGGTVVGMYTWVKDMVVKVSTNAVS
jgi:pilus assembly protein Flp/PilA